MGIISEPIDPDILEPGARLAGVAGVDIDRDHLEASAAELLLERFERRHFLAAWHAPGGPQVQQNRAPAPVAEMPLAPGSVAEGEVGQAQRLLGDHEGRHLPARERRDALPQLDRRGAGAVGRIALEGADPVYRPGNRAADDEDQPQKDANE